MTRDEHRRAFDAHFGSPHNAGYLTGADLQVRVTEATCGDVLVLHVRQEGDRIAECSFQVYGCPASIAAASVLTDCLTGATLGDLSRFQPDRLRAVLGPLSPEERHAYVLAERAVAELVERWEDVDRERREP